MKKRLLLSILFLSLFVFISCGTKSVTITFDVNGGTAIEEQTVPQKSVLEQPTPIREGYTFLGWYTDELFTTKFEPGSEVIRNMTLYAKWSINTITITFDYQSDREDETYSDEYQSTINYPTDPVREGYTFMGWATTPDGTTMFTDVTLPSSDVTVYAVWVQNAYTVQFFLNESDKEPMYTETVLYGEAVKQIPSIPVITGMDSVWSEDLTHITSDLDVYANYKVQTFTVTFKNSSGQIYHTLEVDYGNTITPPETPQQTGYDFIGYYNEDLARNIDLSTYVVTEDIVLVDQFHIKHFVVHFYGGENGGLLTTENVAYLEGASAPTEGLEKPGYAFIGWSQAFNEVTEDLEVYAEYEAIVYQATFHGNGGLFTDETNKYTIEGVFGTNIIAPTPPTKEGFVFVGWYTDLNNDQSELFFGTGIAMPIEGLEVYAKWVELVATTYKVSGNYYFQQEGISADQKTLDGTLVTTKTLAYTPFVNILYGTEISPIREIEGYTFYKFVYQGVDYYDPLDLVEITQDETIDVYYHRQILTVDFYEHINDEISQNRFYVYYNDSVINVPEPTPVEGRTVVWERLNFDHIHANLDVAAIQYDNALQTISFISNDTIIYIATNETSDPHTLVIDVQSPLWDMQQIGYRFLGWYLEGTDILIDPTNLYYDDARFNDENLIRIVAKWAVLEIQHQPENITMDVNNDNHIITIDFDVEPIKLDEENIYPYDFTFILNGQYLSSDDSLGLLISLMSQTANHFTLTLSPTDPYYTFFADKLLLNGQLISGTHTLQIISVGDFKVSQSSDPSQVYAFKVKSIYDDIPESQTIKDYYIIEDFGNDTLRYIFYTNLSYQFNQKHFEIITGSNHITADDSILTTTHLPGEFTFSITDEQGTRIYSGLVVQDIRQFNHGESYQNYLTQTNDSKEDDLFLRTSTDMPYYVGYQNDFYLDLLIRDNNGAKIQIDQTILEYTFYLNDEETPLDDQELTTYLTIQNHVISFKPAANNQHIKVVVEPKYEALKMDMSALTFDLYINDGYNAFTNQELKSLFKQMDVHLINIHRDIEAKLDDNQMYEDGSPINYLANAENDYENYGNVYYRIDGSTDNDSINIEGNFMTIDGSDIAYINADMDGFGTIKYSQAFEVISGQIGIFYYSVYKNTPVNNNLFSMNNLRIIGNTTTPSINYGGTEEEIFNQERLMSQNSGGMLGVVVRNGKGTLNNLVIGNTNIGVTTNAYGYNNANEVLTIDLDYVSIYNSWANSIYLWKGSGVSLSHSNIAGSGGAAIHFDDVLTGTTGYQDPVFILDQSTEINNWVSGQEAWFKAYGMSSIALALKSDINNGMSSLQKTIIQVQENPVTGLETEMFNLVFLSIPNGGAVSYENPDDKTSVLTASEVSFNITDDTGTTVLDRPWNYTKLGDPRIMSNQYGFALGSLSKTEAFYQMIVDIKTLYATAYGQELSNADAGNIASIAGFYQLTAEEALQVANLTMQGQTIHQAVQTIKGSLDYPQPSYIEVIAPITLTNEPGNATVLIELFNEDSDS